MGRDGRRAGWLCNRGYAIPMATDGSSRNGIGASTMRMSVLSMLKSLTFFQRIDHISETSTPIRSGLFAVAKSKPREGIPKFESLTCPWSPSVTKLGVSASRQ
ncbi:hypothetical protein FRC03_004022 [Tulasnella sp. 419]|nr:hypothetical protein FRC03_004022 [Tulasnella sp. 419]